MQQGQTTTRVTIERSPVDMQQWEHEAAAANMPLESYDTEVLAARGHDVKKHRNRQ